MLRSDAQIVETFHLAFLTLLSRRIDPSRYVLKGGANLRYFHDSPRYSEDLDIDASASLAGNLEKKVDDLLAHPTFTSLLRRSDITVDPDTISKPKQTRTTRRWKIALSPSERAARPVATKIEFSARNGETRHATSPVPDRIVAPYGITPPIVPHYLAAAAVEQKVKALAGRSTTQARDVFDLEFLMRRTPLLAGAVDRATRTAAAERAFELDYRAFTDQIAPFLEAGSADFHDADSWARMQEFVADQILAENG